jgi:Tfp pilus assembly protein PilF
MLFAAVVVAGFVSVDFLGEREIDMQRTELNRAVMLRRAGLEGSATGTLKGIVRQDPGNPDAHRLLGEIYLKKKKYDLAAAHFGQAAAQAPNYLRALLGQAQSYEESGRREQAEVIYRRSLEVDPWAYEVCLNYGVFLAMDGRTREARRMFKEGMTLTPDPKRFLANLANLDRLEAK